MESNDGQSSKQEAHAARRAIPGNIEEAFVVLSQVFTCAFIIDRCGVDIRYDSPDSIERFVDSLSSVG